MHTHTRPRTSFLSRSLFCPWPWYLPFPEQAQSSPSATSGTSAPRGERHCQVALSCPGRLHTCPPEKSIRKSVAKGPRNVRAAIFLGRLRARPSWACALEGPEHSSWKQPPEPLRPGPVLAFHLEECVPFGLCASDSWDPNIPVEEQKQELFSSSTKRRRHRTER